MMNRHQQLIQSELEHMLIQNQQKDEFLMMLMAINKQGLLNSESQLHHLQSLQNFQQPNPNNFYNNMGFQGSRNNNMSNPNPHFGYKNSLPNSFAAQQPHAHPSHQGMLNQQMNMNLMNQHPQSHMLNSNTLSALGGNMYANQNSNNNNCNATTSRMSNMSIGTTTSSHSYLNNNMTSETNLLIPDQNVSSKHMYYRDSETKKNMDLSDLSMQLEESTTKMSLNRNSFGFQQQPQSFGIFSQQQNGIQIAKQPYPQQYYYGKLEDSAEHGLEMKDNKDQHYIRKNNGNNNFACGYKFIDQNENNHNTLMSKIQKNPMVSSLADSLTYIYTFEPHRLEQEGVLESLFLSGSKSSAEEKNSMVGKSESDTMMAPINTTVIQLNNKNWEDPLSNLSAGHLFDTTQKQSKSTGLCVGINNKTTSIIESMNFSTQLLSKSFSLANQTCAKDGKSLYVKEESEEFTENSLTGDEIQEDEEIAKQNTKFIKKGHNSLRFNSRLVNTIENFLKKQLMFSSNPSKEDNDNSFGNGNERSEQPQKAVPFSEKVKTLKGQLDFEDITNHITLESKVNEDLLKKEVQQILHHFKSNHKVYFKKVRSQKEMLKDTKFHNLNKRIMRVLLSILNNPIVLSLKVPKPIFNFFNTMSTKLVNSSKKLIKNTIVNDQYSHAHYNTMFLQISASNYSKLNQSQSDIDLHKIIYDIDLTLPYSHNYYEIQKTNILKQYIFLILDRTLRLNDTAKDSSIQAIRSMYIDRVIKGMEKMNAGKIVQRF